MHHIEKRIKNIENRNKRVEMDKAWETSWVRRIIIATLTYGVIMVFMSIAQFPNPWIGAVVPSVGYILSTLTLGIAKKLWMNYTK